MALEWPCLQPMLCLPSIYIVGLNTLLKLWSVQQQSYLHNPNSSHTF